MAEDLVRAARALSRVFDFVWVGDLYAAKEVAEVEIARFEQADKTRKELDEVYMKLRNLRKRYSRRELVKLVVEIDGLLSERRLKRSDLVRMLLIAKLVDMRDFLTALIRLVRKEEIPLGYDLTRFAEPVKAAMMFAPIGSNSYEIRILTPKSRVNTAEGHPETLKASLEEELNATPELAILSPASVRVGLWSARFHASAVAYFSRIYARLSAPAEPAEAIELAQKLCSGLLKALKEAGMLRPIES